MPVSVDLPVRAGTGVFYCSEIPQLTERNSDTLRC